MCFGAIAIGVILFALCEIRVLKKRDNKLAKEIRTVTMKQIDRLRVTQERDAQVYAGLAVTDANLLPQMPQMPVMAPDQEPLSSAKMN